MQGLPCQEKLYIIYNQAQNTHICARTENNCCRTSLFFCRKYDMREKYDIIDDRQYNDTRMGQPAAPQVQDASENSRRSGAPVFPEIRITFRRTTCAESLDISAISRRRRCCWKRLKNWSTAGTTRRASPSSGKGGFLSARRRGVCASCSSGRRAEQPCRARRASATRAGRRTANLRM